MGASAKVNGIKKIFLVLWPFGCIIGLWILFSFPYFFKGLIPFPSRFLVTFFAPWNTSYAMPVKNNAMPDVISQIFPWKKVTVDTWKMGQVPLWNPYSFAGTPHAANFQTGVFSPLTLLFGIFPFVDAWSVMILLQPLLAGLFMYLFLYYLCRIRMASVIGAFGYMFSGYIVTWMAYGTIGYAYLFLPLLLYAIRREFDKTQWTNIVLIALSIVGSLTQGHFQISIYVLMAGVLYIFYIGWSEKKRLVAIHTFGIFGLAVLLAAPQLLLTLKAFGESTRNIFIEKREIIPWQNLITFIAPDFFGNPVTRNDWFGHYAEWLGYVGVVPFVLSVYAITKNIHKGKIFFLLLLLIAIFLAYPTPASSLLFVFKIPLLSTSAASRIIILASFSLIGLSAYGFMDWQEDRKKHTHSSFYITAGIIGFLLILSWAVIFFTKMMPSEAVLIVKRNFVLPSILLSVTLLILGIGYVKYLSKVVILFSIVLICISGFDTYRFASKWMPFDERQFIYPKMKILQFLQEQGSIDRVFGGIGNEVGSMFSIPLIEGYDALYKRRYGQFVASSSDGILKDAERSIVSFDKHGIYRDRVLQLLGVKYIVHRISDGRNIWAFPYWEYLDGDMNSIYKDEHYEVFIYSKALPRTFLASSYMIENNDQEILQIIFDKTFDLQKTVVVEKKPSLEPQSGDGVSVITTYTPNYVQIKTVTTVPKLLFLSDVYDTGWLVFVDGKKEEILRADYAFRAVSVPAGDHVIEFVYQPKEFLYGLAISFFAFIILLAIILYKNKKNHI